MLAHARMALGTGSTERSVVMIHGLRCGNYDASDGANVVVHVELICTDAVRMQAAVPLLSSAATTVAGSVHFLITFQKEVSLGPAC